MSSYKEVSNDDLWAQDQQEEWSEYEQRNHRFNAPPSDELDDSWRKLLEGV